MVKDLKQALESYMIAYLKKNSYPKKLQEALLYSLEAGGKRLRPLLVFQTVEAFGKEVTEGVLACGAALEMLHTYSLIHDDLPAMDNDDLRRGVPTNHKVFGEALGILAGDGLLTAAFTLLAESNNPPEVKVKLLQLLGEKAGNTGMIAGQTLDILSEGKEISLGELKEIHRLKTGELLSFSFMAGGILAKKNEETLLLLEKIGEKFGLGFQIRDDLLDVLGNTKTLGKNTQQDALLKKATYPGLLGIDGAKEALRETVNEVKNLMAQLDDFSTDYLVAALDKLEKI